MISKNPAFMNLLNQHCSLPQILQTMKKPDKLALYNINYVSFDTWYSSFGNLGGGVSPTESWKTSTYFNTFLSHCNLSMCLPPVLLFVYVCTHRAYIFLFFEQFVSYKCHDMNPLNVSACTSYEWEHFLHSHTTNVIPKNFNTTSKIQSISKRKKKARKGERKGRGRKEDEQETILKEKSDFFRFYLTN